MVPPAWTGLVLGLVCIACLCEPGAAGSNAMGSGAPGTRIANPPHWAGAQKRLQRSIAALLERTAPRGMESQPAGDGGDYDETGASAHRRDQAEVRNGLSGMVVPVVMVLIFLLIITLIKECARIMWRRSLLRTMKKLKANQAQILQSQRPSIFTMESHRKAYF